MSKELSDKYERLKSLGWYQRFKVVIDMDMSRIVASEFSDDGLADFIKYRLNFKHGTDDQVVICDINVSKVEVCDA